jgi:hypothetical protein
MSIYRGAGGAGDAVADSASEALLVRELAIEVQADADAAAASATAAASSASGASSSASAASTSASNASTSATAASGSASSASTSASNASTSATNASNSATSASTSATTATTQAGIATTKAGEAATSATNAAGSATAASGSASTASTQATNASNSASSASTSATNAANSATAAAASAASINPASIVITGGSINGTTIGATTASTGAFSALSATGVTTVQAGTVSAPAITTTGDTNTGIFFPAADTIAFTEGGAESMRIDSAGNVGIGLTNSDSKLHISSTGVGSVRFLYNGLSENYFDADLQIFRNKSNSEAMRIDSAGRVLVGLTSANTSGANLQVSSGITFLATQSASSNANTLDDYEEGTWTGTIRGVTTDPTTSVTATGTYTKIGRLVFARISYSAITTTGASGDFYISGLPFTSAHSDATGNVMTYDLATFAGSNLSPYVTGASVFLYYMSSNGAWNPATHNAGSNRFLSLSVTYQV